jgi:hypothetical protein
VHLTGGKLRETRRFVRVRPTGLVSRVAKIIVDQKTPSLDCSVVDISAGGACLEVCGQVDLPKRFVLLHGGTKKTCNMVWRSGRRFGVAF